MRNTDEVKKFPALDEEDELLRLSAKPRTLFVFLNCLSSYQASTEKRRNIELRQDNYTWRCPLGRIGDY
jgi:hypothetical protein